MNVQKQIIRMNDQELQNNTSFEASWHQSYKYRPWIFVGGLDPQLNEGDVIVVFSQYVNDSLFEILCFFLGELLLSVYFIIDGVKLRISTWSETRKQESPKDSHTSVMKIGEALSLQWTT